MTAILGRMCTYFGKQIEWEKALNSRLELVPEVTSFDQKSPVQPDAQG